MITKVHEYGNHASKIVLLQPVGEHNLSGMEHEVSMISELTDKDFLWLGFQVDNWNSDLSPWEAPAVFGNEAFGCGAVSLLDEILKYCGDRSKIYYLGGYSLAGLFSLWAACRTDVFSGTAAVSPSVWFLEFDEYISSHKLKSKHIYLSLGDKEERTRNPVMRTVGDRIRVIYEYLKEQNISCVLEWNKGNHFDEPDRRTAQGFAWLINNQIGEE